METPTNINKSFTEWSQSQPPTFPSSTRDHAPGVGTSAAGPARRRWGPPRRTDFSPTQMDWWFIAPTLPSGKLT